jgi:hypothetical protein
MAVMASDSERVEGPVSPSNSRMELREKIAAYLTCGAVEMWTDS